MCAAPCLGSVALTEVCFSAYVKTSRLCDTASRAWNGERGAISFASEMVGGTAPSCLWGRVFRRLYQAQRVRDSENQVRLSDRIYNYLDGTMDNAERVVFESELDQNPEWKVELEKYKGFLTLLHSLTGKITLTAEEIKEKVQSIREKIYDFDIIVDATSFENGTPKTTTTHIWFKNPDCHRMEYNIPARGKIVIWVKENYVTSWAIETKKATKVKLSEEYKERLNLNFVDELKRMTENKSSRILETEYMKGRPTLHIQLTEKVNEFGEMSTHLWMDKDTWMDAYRNRKLQYEGRAC